MEPTDMDIEENFQQYQEEQKQSQSTIKRKIPNILITGTPGTGKTTIGKLLCEQVNKLRYYNVGEWIINKKLYKTWNEKFDCPEFDDDMVVDQFEDEIQKEGCVLDFHSSDFFPQRWFDLVVLLRTNNTQLYDRLKARNYSEAKITENIDCEIMEASSDEVRGAYHNDIILELQNDNAEDVQKNIDTITSWLKKKYA